MTEIPTTALTADSATDAAINAAMHGLQLAARLHAAGTDPAAWRLALKAISEWLGCTGLLALPCDDILFDADALELLAGRVSHCAVCGKCACSVGSVDPIRRARCAAFAPHLHEAAAEARNALHALFFDQLPPLWIVDRSGRLHDSNAPAKAVAAACQPLAVLDGLLTPNVPGGGARLRRALAEVVHETRFSWPDMLGGETTLLLRPLPAGAGLAVTLVPGPPLAGQLAALLVQRLKLTLRQSDLAAHLLTDKTLSDAARAMGISRHTANEHLEGLLQRTDAPDRSALLIILRRAVAG